MPLKPETWLARKRREVEQADPLSLQVTIGALSSRLALAEAMLRQVRMLHRADELGVHCVGCSKPWPCATFTIVGAP